MAWGAFAFAGRAVERMVSGLGPAALTVGYHASYWIQLVVVFTFLVILPTGEHFHIEVAAYPEIHPEAKSYASDIRFLKAKLDAGANSAITQYFFNVESYFYFLDQCAAIGINKPIYAGIMPIINFANLQRFSRNCGAEIPRWIRKRLESFGDDTASIKAFGLDVVTDLCEQFGISRKTGYGSCWATGSVATP